MLTPRDWNKAKSYVCENARKDSAEEGAMISLIAHLTDNEPENIRGCINAHRRQFYADMAIAPL